MVYGVSVGRQSSSLERWWKKRRKKRECPALELPSENQSILKWHWNNRRGALQELGKWQTLCYNTHILNSVLLISFLEDKVKHFFSQLPLSLEWRHGIVLAKEMNVCWERGVLLRNEKLFWWRHICASPTPPFTSLWMSVWYLEIQTVKERTRESQIPTSRLDTIQSLIPAITYLQKYCNMGKKYLFQTLLVSFLSFAVPLLPMPSKKIQIDLSGEADQIRSYLF